MEFAKSKNINKMQMNFDVFMSTPLFHYFLIEFSAQKKPGLKYQCDISATRLSLRDPLGFPSHPHGWFSIIVYLRKINLI